MYMYVCYTTTHLGRDSNLGGMLSETRTTQDQQPEEGEPAEEESKGRGQAASASQPRGLVPCLGFVGCLTS